MPSLAEHTISITVSHTLLPGAGNDPIAFWAPFKERYLSAHPGNTRCPQIRWYEAVLKINLGRLLADTLTDHFKKAFFDIDSRYKTSPRPSPKEREELCPEYKPGRIDESFIEFYEDDFYKTDADRLVSCAYIHFTLDRISYNPTILTLSVLPLEEFMSLFDNRFEKAYAFFKKNIPAAFMQAVQCSVAAGCEEMYKNLELSFKVLMGEGFRMKTESRRRKAEV